MSTDTMIETTRNSTKLQSMRELKGKASPQNFQFYDSDDDENASFNCDELNEVFSGSRSIHHKSDGSLEFKPNEEIIDPYLDPTETCSTFSFFDEDDYLLTECNLEDVNCTETARVRFGQVRVREYQATIGDHPLCIDGFPLSLDWSFSDENEYDIETFECKRFLLRRDVPRRLGLDQRKDRVMETVNLTLEELEDYLDSRRKDTELQAKQAVKQKWQIILEEAMEVVAQRSYQPKLCTAIIEEL